MESPVPSLLSCPREGSETGPRTEGDQLRWVRVTSPVHGEEAVAANLLISVGMVVLALLTGILLW